MAFMTERLPGLLTEARQALGNYVGTSGENVIYFPNPTTAVRTLSRILRLDRYSYKLEASGTATLYTGFGERRFWAELEIAGTVNSSYSRWQGSGELVYRELDTGDITGGISMDFLLTKV